MTLGPQADWSAVETLVILSCLRAGSCRTGLVTKKNFSVVLG